MLIQRICLQYVFRSNIPKVLRDVSVPIHHLLSSTRRNMSNTASVGLDLTPKGLFPKIETATTDPKCVVISEVIQQMIRNSDMGSVTQSTLQDHAAERYTDLSQEGRLSLSDADHRAFLLYQKGVTSETTQKYYSFRLSEADAKKWAIVMI